MRSLRFRNSHEYLLEVSNIDWPDIRVEKSIRHVMDVGYSNLLGEHFAASAISYEDVVPSNSVSIVSGTPSLQGCSCARGFFGPLLSHYVAAEAYAADGEQRVRTMSTKQVERINAEGRGQRLKLFLAVLRETILDSQYAEGIPRDRHRRGQVLVFRSHTLDARHPENH